MKKMLPLLIASGLFLVGCSDSTVNEYYEFEENVNDTIENVQFENEVKTIEDEFIEGLEETTDDYQWYIEEQTENYVEYMMYVNFDTVTIYFNEDGSLYGISCYMVGENTEQFTNDVLEYAKSFYNANEQTKIGNIHSDGIEYDNLWNMELKFEE